MFLSVDYSSANFLLPVLDEPFDVCLLSCPAGLVVLTSGDLGHSEMDP